MTWIITLILSAFRRARYSPLTTGTGTALCLILSCNVFAAEFVLGVESSAYYPHFDFQRDAPGLTRDLFDRFAADEGHHIVYLPLPIKRFSLWLFEENIDFKYPDNVRWQPLLHTHNIKVYFSHDVISLISSISVLEKNRHKGPDFIRHLGTITGFQNTLWMSRIRSGQVKLVEDPSPTVLVNQLLHGIVDGLDIDYSVIQHQLVKLNSEEKVVRSPSLPQQQYAFQLSTLKHPDIILQFNKWLKRNQPFIRELREKYGIPPVYPHTPHVQKHTP